jgi:hypothetical protein
MSLLPFGETYIVNKHNHVHIELPINVLGTHSEIAKNYLVFKKSFSYRREKPKQISRKIIFWEESGVVQ